MSKKLVQMSLLSASFFMGLLTVAHAGKFPPPSVDEVRESLGVKRYPKGETQLTGEPIQKDGICWAYGLSGFLTEGESKKALSVPPTITGPFVTYGRDEITSLPFTASYRIQFGEGKPYFLTYLADFPPEDPRWRNVSVVCKVGTKEIRYFETPE